MTDYWSEPRLQPIAAWLLSKGFVRDRSLLCIAWSTRLGYDFTGLEFWPHDKGCEAIVGHHASGTNPRLSIGTCETLADVQMVYDTIRRINGYPTADAEPEAREQNVEVR
jgi:hypothetical protein